MPRFSILFRAVRDQLSFMEKPIDTPWGFKLVGNRAMALGVFEPVETGLVRTILEDVDVLVNVGANIGYYCCHALGMGKKTIAFEPVPRNVRFLLKNIKINGWRVAFSSIYFLWMEWLAQYLPASVNHHWTS